MSGSTRPYRLSPRAQRDLEDIWFYTFQNWSLEQADRYQNDIMAAIAGLALGTRIGRKVDIRDGYFKYLAGSHFVFYRQQDSSLDVIRVLHQRMDVSFHLISKTPGSTFGLLRGKTWMPACAGMTWWCLGETLSQTWCYDPRFGYIEGGFDCAAGDQAH